MAGRFYVDTSAYLCILLGEAGAAALERELASGELVSSVLLVLEAKRNVVRLAREGALGQRDLQACLDRIADDVGDFQLRDLTLDLCRDVTLPVVSTPRSLDLAHLETARWFHRIEPLRRFVSLDDSQVRSAQELGLPV